MKTSAMLALILAPAALCANPSVERVVVRQQWPWSTDVKVEYSLSGVDSGNPVDISVRAFNGSVELPSANLEAAITGERFGITSPVGAFTIDPVAAFGTEQVALGNFKVQLSLSASSANMNDILYKIVDLDEPYAVTDVRRRDFYNGKYGSFVTNFSDIATGWTTSLDDVLIWTGVTEDDTYKTSKMVFRRIPAKNKSFQFMYGVAAATNAYYAAGQGIKVSFSKDYYIGVFEVTQAQFMKMVNYASVENFYLNNADYSATRPADNVLFYTSNTSKLGVRSIDNKWPNSTSHSLSYSTAYYGLVEAMQAKTGLLVDAPTQAMWEYACRAGTDTMKYSGQGSYTSGGGLNDAFINSAAWTANTQRSGYTRKSWMEVPRTADLSRGSEPVGSLLPNAFGLYDMLGNICEWCLDQYVAAGNLWKESCFSGEDNVDPIGPTSVTESQNSARGIRGGGWGDIAIENGSMGVVSRGNNQTTLGGVRLCIYLDNHDDGTK